LRGGKPPHKLNKIHKYRSLFRKLICKLHIFIVTYIIYIKTPKFRILLNRYSEVYYKEIEHTSSFLFQIMSGCGKPVALHISVTSSTSGATIMDLTVLTLGGTENRTKLEQPLIL